MLLVSLTFVNYNFHYNNFSQFSIYKLVLFVNNYKLKEIVLCHNIFFSYFEFFQFLISRRCSRIFLRIRLKFKIIIFDYDRKKKCEKYLTYLFMQKFKTYEI